MKEISPNRLARSRTFPRRQLLRAGMAGMAAAPAALAFDPAAAIASGVPRQRVEVWLAQAASATPEAMAAYTPKALTSNELATVRAAVGRLIPTDDLGPGADECGVHIYIDQALAGPDAGMLEAYQSGLAALDQAAGSDGFTAASAETQDSVLHAAETGNAETATPVPAGTVSATPMTNGSPAGTPAAETSQVHGVKADIPEGFFPMLLEHTRQGMFGDPVYGGNANFAGWDLIRYPGIKLVWSQDEQEIDVDVKPEHISVEKYGGTGYE